MRISELSKVSGVPVPTVKYYLRECLLHPGEALNARESSYDESHVARLRLIRGLVSILGASIEQVRQVLAVVDTPGLDVLEAMQQATEALPLRPEPSAAYDEEEADRLGPGARILERLGFTADPQLAYARQFEAAVRLAHDVGIGFDYQLLAAYAAAARDLARADFAGIPWQDPKAAVQFAVLGTALYEPVILILRRLAHLELAAARRAGAQQPR